MVLTTVWLALRRRTTTLGTRGLAVSKVAGPLLGGWLTTDASWRWAFWLNIPVGLLVLLGIVKAVPETRDSGATVLRDWGGVVLSALGMGALVFALIESEWFGWWRQEDGSLSPVPLALVLGFVLMGAFVQLERARQAAGLDVLIDLGLFRIRSFRNGAIAALIVAFGEFGLLFTLPLLLQGTLGYTALGTGAVILLLAVGTFLASGTLPQLSKRVHQRTIVRLGLLLEAVAIGGLALTLSSSIATWVIAVWLFVYGFGVGFATAQLTALLLADVPVEESGQASGLQSSVRQFGSALGVALLGGFLVAQLGRATRANLNALDLSGGAVDGITSAVRESAGIAIAGLQAQPGQAAIAQAAGEAMITASRLTTGLAAVALLLGLLATLALPSDAGHARAENENALPEPTGRLDRVQHELCAGVDVGNG
nr:MFS transporter [Tessaracoccus sp. MC1865]